MWSRMAKSPTFATAVESCSTLPYSLLFDALLAHPLPLCSTCYPVLPDCQEKSWDFLKKVMELALYQARHLNHKCLWLDL